MIHRIALTLGFFALSATASADVPPPDIQGCQSKKPGDVCTRDDGSSATCKATTCSKLDYSQGTPPSSVTYDCVLCNGDAAPPATTATGKNCATSPLGATPVSGGAAIFGLAGLAALTFGLRRRAG
ncbi:MAG: hypothetical protein IV100_07865 [Myxococcales bacterium]|nr:hypothetical protein [Myxococcales bacterium]